MEMTRHFHVPVLLPLENSLLYPLGTMLVGRIAVLDLVAKRIELRSYSP